MSIHFTKMHGLGNDFVVINGLQNSHTLTPELIRKMSHRQLGIGFDQLLLLESAQQADIDFHYRIFNADGQEVEICGNGARCIAHFIQEHQLSDKAELTLSTKASQLKLKIKDNNQVAVDMSIPRFEPKDIPFVPKKNVTKQNDHYYSLILKDIEIKFSVVNIGNPHVVIITPNLETINIDTIGQQLNQHPQFPQGVNVGWMQIIDPNRVHLRVFERGAGKTLACGSGACAAMVIGRRNGLLQERVIVEQLGGSLSIEWQGPERPVVMTGPAQTTFFGEWLV